MFNDNSTANFPDNVLVEQIVKSINS